MVRRDEDGPAVANDEVIDVGLHILASALGIVRETLHLARLVRKSSPSLTC